jgi:hypothetical protein
MKVRYESVLPKSPHIFCSFLILSSVVYGFLYVCWKLSNKWKPRLSQWRESWVSLTLDAFPWGEDRVARRFLCACVASSGLARGFEPRSYVSCTSGRPAGRLHSLAFPRRASWGPDSLPPRYGLLQSINCSHKSKEVIRVIVLRYRC